MSVLPHRFITHYTSPRNKVLSFEGLHYLLLLLLPANGLDEICCFVDVLTAGGIVGIVLIPEGRPDKIERADGGCSEGLKTIGDRSDRLTSSEFKGIGEWAEASPSVLIDRDGLPLKELCSSTMSIESMEVLCVLTVDGRWADDCFDSRALMGGWDSLPAEVGLGNGCSWVLAENDGRATIGVLSDGTCSVEAVRSDYESNKRFPSKLCFKECNYESRHRPHFHIGYLKRKHKITTITHIIR